ncbi:hypothetical protein BAE44_0011726 [Dichanthelium oligosanthes]|uniref:FAF domain-containing protein n=1 Tax=Dichanthelium oligosanthes TaxID=888268 RepID=A0A1E5VQ32_9POAL|nr:hypothetical protein BAE44_0011726 [Dichanthelium oligosanthes]
MLLSAHHHSAERFSAPVTGLRSLLVAPDAGRGVVMRAAVVPSRCGGEDVRASGDGTSTGNSEDDTNKAKDDDEEDMKAKEKEAGSAELEEEELDGFWVSYGRRCPRRRLPPPIPSLVAHGALRRTRTGDGRLVIRIVPVVRPECIRARRRGGRLTMQLVEHDDDSPMMAPPLREPSSARHDDDDIIRIAQDDAEDPVVASLAVPPPRVSSAGCFEDVFKYDSIGGSSVHHMPSLRMVH